MDVRPSRCPWPLYDLLLFCCSCCFVVVVPLCHTLVVAAVVIAAFIEDETSSPNPATTQQQEGVDVVDAVRPFRKHSPLLQSRVVMARQSSQQSFLVG